eukprot:TRINITY_DN19766_c0_g1_i2.p1 TRINITY_DN19766_c0_g1~~TRINITY_DN19766_c0_g1_i2.p1  ORF type:complete len:329 (+),score=38.23 TRINITY_DN19766_c0_g1_i2:614-1600(+)
MFDVVANPDFQSFNELYLVTECCGSDLSQLLRSDAFLKAKHVNTLLYDLLAGLNCVHSAGIVLCELDPATDYSLKICGFGSSRALIEDSLCTQNPLHVPRSTPQEGSRHSSLKQCSGIVANRWYRALELLLNQERITTAVDLWSAGCIYAELFRMLPGTAIQDRAPLFPGGPDQLRHVFGAIGTPGEADLTWLDSDASRNHLKDYYFAWTMGKQLISKFPKSPAGSVTMLDHLLKFVASARWSAEEALDDSLFHDLRPQAASKRGGAGGQSSFRVYDGTAVSKVGRDAASKAFCKRHQQVSSAECSCHPPSAGQNNWLFIAGLCRIVW